jgi:DNA-binding transcriptional LysR family regulator
MVVMRKVNLHSLDLNLLPPLEALLRLRSVTLAAEEVGMSQPAMSRALARLRDVLGDALLVRTAQGFALTVRARELQPHLAPALEGIGALYRVEDFSPRTTSRVVRIAASDAQTVMLLPMIMQRLEREAPEVSVQVSGYARDTVARMVSGDLDFAFATAGTPLPPGAASMVLTQDRLALVMRKGHPAEHRRIVIGDYQEFDHATISLMNDNRSDLDAALAAQGIQRRIAMTTPHFMAALTAVSATDMVTTISRALAQRFAESLGLTLREPPIEQAELTLTLVWSQLRTGDRFLDWMRDVIRDAAGQVHGGEGSPA